MNVRKVVVIYMPETHKDLVDSLRRRVQRDVQETISATNLGMLLKPISASDALYTRAVEQIFLHDPNGMAQLLAIDSCGTFEGKLRPRSDAGGAREDWAKQCTTDLDDIMRDAAEAQRFLVETFSSGSRSESSTPLGRRWPMSSAKVLPDPVSPTLLGARLVEGQAPADPYNQGAKP